MLKTPMDAISETSPNIFERNLLCYPPDRSPTHGPLKYEIKTYRETTPVQTSPSLERKLSDATVIVGAYLVGKFAYTLHKVLVAVPVASHNLAHDRNNLEGVQVINTKRKKNSIKLLTTIFRPNCVVI